MGFVGAEREREAVSVVAWEAAWVYSAGAASAARLDRSPRT